MVMIFLPTAADDRHEQERTGSPSTCTVQAPHAAMPQPYLVPVRPSSSRRTHSSGAFGLDVDGVGAAVHGQARHAFLPPKRSGQRRTTRAC